MTLNHDISLAQVFWAHLFVNPRPYLFNPPPCYFNPPRPYFFQPSCLNMSIYEVLVLEEPWTGIDKNGTYSLLLPAHTLQLLSSAEIDLPDPQPYQLLGRPRKIDKLNKLEEGCRWGFVARTNARLPVPVVLQIPCFHFVAVVVVVVVASWRGLGGRAQGLIPSAFAVA